MRYILIGQVSGKNGEIITKVLNCGYFEPPPTKDIRKYIKNVLSHHVSKVTMKEIMSKPEGSKDMFRLTVDEDNTHTITEAVPGYVYGTNKKVLVKVWVQIVAEDITPKKFAELQN